MARQRHLIIAAGGTGGHMFPAQALAEAMVARGWRVTLSTDARGARYAGGFPAEVRVEQVTSATFARGGPAAKALVPLRLAAGVSAALARMALDRPTLVAGFGGYPSVPALVQAFACGTWPCALPAGVAAEHTGNPVRAAVHARAGAPYIPPGDYPMSVLVLGGSQGARILSDAVPAGLAALPDTLRAHLRVAHQARPEDLDRAVAAYDAAGIAAEVQPFFDDIPRRLSEAQLVIARAGASTVAELGVIGRPAILVPFAAALGDHQTANARALVEAGAAVMIPESRLKPEALADATETVLSQPDAAVQMAHAALDQAVPDATERLVDLVERVAAGRSA